MNLIPLQNVVSNTSGLDATAGLSNSIASLQQMINVDTKTIYTDYLGAFTTGNSIQVQSPLNLCNVGISANGIPIILETVGTTGTSAFAPSTMGVQGRTILQILPNGNTLFYDSQHIATEVRVSSMNFAADLITASTITVGGKCFAQQFVTLSDMNMKKGISSIGGFSVNELKGIGTYSYRYIDASADDSSPGEIGLLAQEIEALYPECVVTGVGGNKYVKYNSIVALLLATVRSFGERIARLEASRP